jgi:hypothetical protein
MRARSARRHTPRTAALQAHAQRQYLYFCTSKASKLSTCAGAEAYEARHVVRAPRLRHTSAYVSIRQHTSAYVSIRQHTSAYVVVRAPRLRFLPRY